jgi:hypothetical protein
VSAPERPPLGKLAVGDPVFVILSSNLHRGATREQRTLPAEVVEVKRVWCVLREEGRGAPVGRHWRMRLDDQDEGDRTYPQNNDRFVTPAQHAYETALYGARAYLREQGVQLAPRSPWVGREVQLAAVLRAAAPDA